MFVSQSGETADTLRALEYAKGRGALCMGITNTVGSAISRMTDCGIYSHAGYEVGHRADGGRGAGGWWRRLSLPWVFSLPWVVSQP